MTIIPLTYTRDAATCPTLGGRTGEADCSVANGACVSSREAKLPPPYMP